MKIYRTIIIVAGLALFSSCSDSMLDTSSPSIMSPEVVYNDQSMAEKVLLGVYSKLTEDATYSQDLSITFNLGTDIERVQFTVGSPDSSQDRAVANYLATAGNSYVTRVTDAMYVAIERANVLIEGIEEGESYQSGDEEFAVMHGEAVVLRAVCYRNLIRILGDVPFKIEPTKTDLSNVYLPKTDRFEVMETLIDQLITYADELPWKQSTPERVTQGFARGLAAQIALMRAGWNYSTDCEWVAPQSDADEYYKIAREQTEIVMQSGEYSLTSSYYSFFYGMCQREYLPNESLYEVGFVVARSSELAYTMGARISSTTSTYGYTTQGKVYTTPEFFYSFDPEDTRRDVSVDYVEYVDISNTTNYANGVTSSTGLSANIVSNPANFRIAKWSTMWCPSDFAIASYSAGGKVGTGINYCMMRYSDILLMFAEADYALNGITDAGKAAFYEVRSRAIPTLSSSQFDSYIASKDYMQAIEDERRWEFAGEGSRKWDLLRWGKLPQAIIDHRDVNYKLYNEWSYDFEFPTRTLASGEVVQRVVPTDVYYSYDSKNELIEDINIDYAMEAPTSSDYFVAYDGSVWIYRSRASESSGDDNVSTYLQVLNETASGLVDTSGNLVLNGRPFYPIPSTMIVDYNGVISQDYGFTNN